MTSAFNSTTTADQVLGDMDLRNYRFLITGVSSGVGAETARTLVARGATVIGTVRSPAKAQDEISSVQRAAEQGGGAFEVIELDLASLRSIHAGADKLQAEGHGFDVILANAGVMATPFGHTDDGFETQFGTNHLGHFVLVNRLMSSVRPGGRVVIVSSNGHRGADVDLDDPNFDITPYDPWVAYGRSKTANSLFAVELDRRYRGSGIRACAVMPGTSDTPLMRHLTDDKLDEVFNQIASDRKKGGAAPLKLKTLTQMAATSVWAAVVAEGEKIGGRYLENCNVAEVDDVPGIRDGVMSYALDPERARLLWEKSEELVDEYFEPQ